MKKSLFGILVLVVMLLSACATRIYGVPEERWETMSEQERIAAMEAYKARQEALRQRRAEQARLRAMEKQAQLEREAEEARQRQLQIDAIYRGEGLYGDLIRVTLEGGMLQFYGDHKPFHPVSFKIAADEMKQIEVASLRGHKAHMTVLYDGSNLLLDETPRSHRSRALRLAYENSWEDGATYSGLHAKGPLEMRGVNVSIQVIGRPPHGRHGRRHPSKHVIQPPARKTRKPSVIVIKEPEERPEPVIIVVNNSRKERKPEVIVVKSEPQRENHRNRMDQHSRKERAHSGYPASIKVALRKGRLKVKNRSYPVEPQTIEVRDGEQRHVFVRTKRGNLKVLVSYVDGELLINDRPNQGHSGTRLGYMPTWKDGQGYVIKAAAGLMLEDLDILIESQ